MDTTGLKAAGTLSGRGEVLTWLSGSSRARATLHPLEKPERVLEYEGVKGWGCGRGRGLWAELAPASSTLPWLPRLGEEHVTLAGECEELAGSPKVLAPRARSDWERGNLPWLSTREQLGRETGLAQS